MNSNMLAKRFAAVQKGILSALELKARYKLTPKVRNCDTGLYFANRRTTVLTYEKVL